jgi:hypothetical protein
MSHAIPDVHAFFQVGGNVKSWHWRWFEIDQIYMSYYRSHYHPDPIKRIQLSDILSVTYAAVLRVIFVCCEFQVLEKNTFVL